MLKCVDGYVGWHCLPYIFSISSFCTWIIIVNSICKWVLMPTLRDDELFLESMLVSVTIFNFIIIMQWFAWRLIKQMSFKLIEWREREKCIYWIQMVNTGITILLHCSQANSYSVIMLESVVCFGTLYVCVYVCTVTAISQLLSNYTNKSLNRWRMEKDFTQLSLSVINIQTVCPESI